MCGIAFIINYNPKTKIDKNLIKHMFIEMEFRGTDASGYYFERENEGKMEVLARKHNIPATDLWDKTQEKKRMSKDDKRYKITGDERLILLHTRAKTRGDPIDNNNNHPIFSDNYVLIHNGQIHSTRLSYYDYKGRVDSEEILAYIETFGIREGLKKLNGDMSIIFKKYEDDEMFLYRNTNPLDLVYFPSKKILIGISSESFIEIDWIHKSVQNKIFSPYFIYETLPPDALYKISLTKKQFTLLDYIKVASNWGGKTQVWKKGEWVYE